MTARDALSAGWRVASAVGLAVGAALFRKRLVGEHTTAAKAAHSPPSRVARIATDDRPTEKAARAAAQARSAAKSASGRAKSASAPKAASRNKAAPRKRTAPRSSSKAAKDED